MKHRILPLFALCSLAALASSTKESKTSTELESATTTERYTQTPDSALTQRMRKQQELISRRLGISAPLDAAETTDPATGIDAIQELYDSGFLIPATLAQVEAALTAAALTPDLEDDRAAFRLKHRGTYRYFLQN